MLPQRLTTGSFGRSLLATATAAAGRTLLDIPGTENTWTAPQTTQISGTNFGFHRILPIASDTYSKPFTFSAGSFDNSDGTKNFVFRMWHNSVGGVVTDLTRGAVGDEYEADYVPYPGTRVIERHLCATPAYSGVTQRFISAFVRTDAAPSLVSENSMAFKIDQLIHANRTGVTEYWRCDETAGFWMTNLAEGMRLDTTASGHGLRIGKATSSSGNYLGLLYNGAEFSTINSYGEVYLGGSGKAGAGTRDCMLKVAGRTGSSSTAEFLDTSGNASLQIRSAGDYIILRSPIIYARGDITVQEQGVFTTNTVLKGNGQIWTNQATATIPTGAVVGSFAVRNAAGTLIGYAELKALS